MMWIIGSFSYTHRVHQNDVEVTHIIVAEIT